MSLWGSLKNAVTSPFRAIGQLVQGKPRGFIGALGDSVKPIGAAMAATGIGGPLGIPIAALGGAMQKADDEGQRGIGDFLKGGAQGAALGATAAMGGGLVRGGMSALGVGGGGAAGVPAGPPTMASTINANLPSIGTTGANVGSGARAVGSVISGSALTPQPQGFGAGNALPKTMDSVGAFDNFKSGIEKGVPPMAPPQPPSGIGGFLKSHPEVAMYGIGGLTNAVGSGFQAGTAAEQMQQQMQLQREQLAYQKERDDEDRKVAIRNMLLSNMAGMQQRGY